MPSVRLEVKGVGTAIGKTVMGAGLNPLVVGLSVVDVVAVGLLFAPMKLWTLRTKSRNIPILIERDGLGDLHCEDQTARLPACLCTSPNNPVSDLCFASYRTLAGS